MTSHIGSVSIYIDADDPPTASLNPGNNRPFAVLQLTPSVPADVYIALRTYAEADALVKAALAARDLLRCGDIAEHTRRSCELAPGHDGWHRAAQITWPWADGPALPDYAEPPGIVTSAEPAPGNSRVGGGQDACYAERETDDGISVYICLAVKGHTGPHMAYGSPDENGDYEVCMSWPQESTCGPGACTCGAHVSADGTVTPAGAM